MSYRSTKIIELGSCAFRQFGAGHSHCQYLHGYQLKAKFIFGSSSLDERNWVVDFGGLKKLKEVLQHQFDHTLCIAANDPCLELFEQLERAGACVLRIMPGGVGIEKTAEYCFEAASSFITEHYGERCWVESVEVYEHEANTAIYTKPKVITASYTDSVANIPVVENTAQLEVAQPEITPSSQPPRNTGAAFGNKVTSGWSNPFGGTSWGV
jgi:6-pyruvoyltetrahydropterin/6-carboxytetrahydropterin synthase